MALSPASSSSSLCVSRRQAGGVLSTVPSAPLPGQRRLGAGLPPLHRQNSAAVPPAAKGRQVTHTTLLPHRSHHYQRYFREELRTHSASPRNELSPRELLGC